MPPGKARTLVWEVFRHSPEEARLNRPHRPTPRRDCGHQVEPDPAEQAERYGAEMMMPDWHELCAVLQMRQPRNRHVVTGRRR